MSECVCEMMKHSKGGAEDAEERGRRKPQDRKDRELPQPWGKEKKTRPAISKKVASQRTGKGQVMGDCDS